jgi:two-component system NtrC family sensor kinase
MTSNMGNRKDISDLRKRAEKLLSQSPRDVAEEDYRNIQVLIHELSVYQVELEMQNENLRNSQMELQESRDKYLDLYDTIPVASITLDKEALILEANSTSSKLFGVGKRDLINSSFTHLIAPESQDTFYLTARKIFKTGQKQSYELKMRKTSGDMFFAYLESVAVPDPDGVIIGQRVAIIDITERKNSEEREQELQRELYLSSRLAAIGELAAGVAHQINNPLTGVLGFSQRLLKKSTDPETSQSLKRIYSEAERAAKVVQNLLTFARRRQPQKQYSDINEILESALELRAYELTTSNIEVVTNLAPDLPEIMLDFHQIQEVFLNIILNAEQALTEANDSGKLVIKTEEKKEYIRTTFNDNGPGIPAEHLDKIFDPFFTTKGEKGGTGLGLSVCHGIISEHGGKIYAKCKPGKGTMFFIELPNDKQQG